MGVALQKTMFHHTIASAKRGIVRQYRTTQTIAMYFNIKQDNNSDVTAVTIEWQSST